MEIRKIKESDSKLLLNYVKELVETDKERVDRPEDIAKITEDGEKKWIEQRLFREDKKEIFVLCGVDDNGAIVAEGEVERLPRWMEKHVAEIRFGVLPGRGPIAKKIAEELIKIAKNNGIEVLIYFHLKTQKTGLDIMNELEFESMGTIKKYYKRGEEYIDRVYLVKYL
jgi:hypothetical protein